MNRRNFVKTSALSALGISLISGNSASALHLEPFQQPLIRDLKKQFPDAVIIDSIDILRYKKNYLLRVVSKDGDVGITQGNSRLKNMLTFFKNQVAGYFIGKDCREIERLVEKIYVKNRNYKYAGMTLWNSVAHIEIAVLDLLGKKAGLPVNQMIGEVKRNEIPVYMSSTERDTTAEEEIEWVAKRVEDTNAKAVKLKIGGRMSKNKDASPGRSEALIRLARENWGDDFTIYFDSNGSYDVPNAIKWGKMLEEYGVGFYEEPVPWEDFAGTKAVNEGLSIPVAGGEQDNSMPKWEWMIRNRAVDIAQPDIMYNGGMIRSLQVARLCDEAGIPCTLHSPKNNGLAAYMLHFASIVKNPGAYQEFRAKLPKDESYFTPSLRVKNGKLTVPEGPGFGVDYDPDYLRKMEVI